jgi:hypothetical protein
MSLKRYRGPIVLVASLPGIAMIQHDTWTPLTLTAVSQGVPFEQPDSSSFIIPETGWYEVGFSVNWYNSSGASNRSAQVRVNGNSLAHVEEPMNGGSWSTIGDSRPALLNSGDVLTLEVMQDSGSTLNIYPSPERTRLTITKLY